MSRRIGPKWGDPNRKRSKNSRKHEKRVAGLLGGKTTPASGAVPFTRRELNPDSVGGDIVTRDFLIEHKSTSRGSLSIKREWLEKVRRGADKKMLDAALVITYTDGKGRPLEEWVAVPMDVFRRMVDNGLLG